MNGQKRWKMEEKDLSCFGLVFTACSVFGRLLASIFYNALHWIVEYSTLLHCIVVYYILLLCSVSYYIALHCIVVYCTILQCIALYRTNIALHCIARYCTVLRDVADLWRRASSWWCRSSCPATWGWWEFSPLPSPESRWCLTHRTCPLGTAAETRAMCRTCVT